MDGKRRACTTLIFESNLECREERLPAGGGFRAAELVRRQIERLQRRACKHERNKALEVHLVERAPAERQRRELLALSANEMRIKSCNWGKRFMRGRIAIVQSTEGHT